jgi:hypothetical protein
VDAVTETEPGHFRVATGGDVKIEWKKAETGSGSSTSASPGYSVIKRSNHFRISLGCTVSLSVSKQNGSMSVLIPGQGPLLHRACVDQQEWYLLEWFATNEVRAWEAVNAMPYGTKRPEKIFLVTGQTLTSEYNISHQEHTCTGCEIAVEASAEILSLANAKLFMGSACQKVSACFGFEVAARKSGAEDAAPCYSVYLEQYESFPMKRFQKETLSARLVQMFGCIFGNDLGFNIVVSSRKLRNPKSSVLWDSGMSSGLPIKRTLEPKKITYIQLNSRMPNYRRERRVLTFKEFLWNRVIYPHGSC